MMHYSIFFFLFSLINASALFTQLIFVTRGELLRERQFCCTALEKVEALYAKSCFSGAGNLHKVIVFSVSHVNPDYNSDHGHTAIMLLLPASDSQSDTFFPLSVTFIGRLSPERVQPL
jgi:hypothetical protein